MRSFVFGLVLAVAVGFMGVGHAAELASCKGNVGVAINSPLDSFVKDCLDTPFQTAAEGPITISVKGTNLFTGTIQGTLTALGTGNPTRFDVSASYLAGQLADGSESADFTLPAGVYKFTVHAEGLGSFEGAVNEATAPEPTGSPSPTDSPSPDPTDTPSPSPEPTDSPSPEPTDSGLPVPTELPTLPAP